MRALAEYLKVKKGLRKILVVGSGAVGKTSLVKVLSSGMSLEEMSSQGLEYRRTMFLECETVDVKSGRFVVYDVAGQLDLPIHALRELKDVVIPKVDLVLLVFAANNLQSFLQLDEWYKLIITTTKELEAASVRENVRFVLIKNKIDLPDVIDETLVKRVLQDPNIVNYFPVSCKTGEGVEILLKWLIEHLLGKK